MDILEFIRWLFIWRFLCVDTLKFRLWFFIRRFVIEFRDKLFCVWTRCLKHEAYRGIIFNSVHISDSVMHTQSLALCSVWMSSCLSVRFLFSPNAVLFPQAIRLPSPHSLWEQVISIPILWNVKTTEWQTINAFTLQILYSVGFYAIPFDADLSFRSKSSILVFFRSAFPDQS